MRWAGPCAAVALVAMPSLAAAHLETLNFPSAGATYAEARASLLKQGVQPVREKATHHDRRFQELDCSRDTKERPCRAVFLHTQRDGWKVYVVVYTHNDSDKTVIDADYPRPVEGLLSIAPPIPPDMPAVRGSYAEARIKLRELGFKPARRSGEPQGICLDRPCNRRIKVSEAQCAMDVPVCIAYWIAPDQRILAISAVGEINPRIEYMRWSTRKDLNAFLR